MRRLKLTAAIVLLLIIGAIIMQNLEPIKTNLIVGSLEMPLAALLVCTLLIGYVLGLLTTALWKVRSWRSQALAARQQAASDKLSLIESSSGDKTSAAGSLKSDPLSASKRSTV